MNLRLRIACLAMLLIGLGSNASAQTQPPTIPGSRWRDCSHCPEMVVLPTGKFLMGSSPAELARDTAAVSSILYRWTFRSTLSQVQPEHEVSLSRPFALGRYLVTRREFSVFVQATGYRSEPGCIFYDKGHYVSVANGSWLNPGFVQSDRDPVVCINVADAEAYIGWLNQQVGGGEAKPQGGPYRLPSEAEWEYAARAGTRTARWWGDAIGINNADCLDCGSIWDGKQTAPVDYFPDNPFGISGLLGNAWEWTADCWNPDYRSAPTDGTSWSTGDCSEHVFRGGGLSSSAFTLLSSTRSHYSTLKRVSSDGFRVARNLPTNFTGK